MKGKKKVSGMTKELEGIRGSSVVEVFYDTKNDTVIGFPIKSSFNIVLRNGEHIIRVARVMYPMTMKEIEELVNKRMEENQQGQGHGRAQ